MEKMKSTEMAEQDKEYSEFMKHKLRSLCLSEKFCGLCLQSEEDLNTMSMEFTVNKQKNSKCLHDILNYLVNDDIMNLTSSNYVCQSCTEKAIQSYLFINNIKQTSKLMDSCVLDLYSKINDTHDQFDTTLDLENANVMIVLESDKEPYKTIVDTDKLEIVSVVTPPMVIKEEKHNIKAKGKEIKFKLSKEEQSKPTNIKLLLMDGWPKSSLKRKRNQSSETFTCAECRENFRTSKLLRRHERIVHNKTEYPCELCQKTFYSWNYLVRHYKTHNQRKCKYCCRIFPVNELMQHLKTKHADLVFPCRFCDLVYYSADTLVTHFHVSHLVNTSEVASQCVMCLNNMSDEEKKAHKCLYACTDCYEMPCIHFKYLAAYREQILNHGNRVKCCDCNYVTHEKKFLIGHVNQKHLDHRPFTCDDCGQQFYTKSKLRTHISLFHLDARCEYCDLVFNYVDTLEKHKKQCKSIVRAFSCNACNASFDTVGELTNHEILRHTDNVAACTFCKSKFLDVAELEQHHKREHANLPINLEPKYIECSLCDIKLTTVNEVLEHQPLHGAGDVFSCHKCEESFDTLMSLYLHNRHHKVKKTSKCKYCLAYIAAPLYPEHVVQCSFKEKVLRHICEICGKAFPIKCFLTKHMQSHAERAPCPKCKKLIKPHCLKKHLEKWHGAPVEILRQRKKRSFYPCELCGHLNQKKEDLEAHINRYHLKIKPYLCHMCEKAFCSSIRLRDHVATHTADKMCSCSVCGKRFANRVCLKMHFRTHTGELPNACDVCGERFRSASIMNSHKIKKHVGKTVGCPLCDSMFYDLASMRTHFKRVHWKFKDKPFDVKQIKELSEEHYHLFEDRRLPKLE